MASIDDCSHQKLFFEWISIQQLDLSHLQEAQTLSPDTENQDARLSQLIEENIKHFEDYNDKRKVLARRDVSVFFAPNWCTSQENSLLWIAGCRPSTLIRLVYSLCGLEIESRLTQFLEGERTGDLGELTANQLTRVNNLQSKTNREEEKMSNQMAILHDDIADQPIVTIVKQWNQTTESNGEEDQVLDEHARAMLSMMQEADQLRLSTLKELLGILSPVQGVEFLSVSKRLHLCMHACMGAEERPHAWKKLNQYHNSYNRKI